MPTIPFFVKYVNIYQISNGTERLQVFDESKSSNLRSLSNTDAKESHKRT